MFLISFVILSLTHGSFRSMLFNFQTFWDFLFIFLLLISTLHCSQKTHVISKLGNLFKLDLWPST